MISYAQNFEDVMLWRALKHIEKGFYVDVGAAWAEEHSVTKVFYDAGWAGINIEPNPHYIKNLKLQRSRDINLQLAVSDVSERKTFYFIQNTGLSSLDESVVKSHERKGYHAQELKVEVNTLSQILNEHACKQEIHFLKIDVEGIEKQALIGNDWKIFRPWIVIVEATVPMSQEENHEDWEYILLDANYQCAYKDGLNRFYIAEEHEELLPSFKYPPNVFDEFTPYELYKKEQIALMAEVKIEELKNKIILSNIEIEAMLQSRSWRITKPLRDSIAFKKRLPQLSHDFFTLAPESISRNLLQRLLLASKSFITRYPLLKNLFLNIMMRAPKVSASIFRLADIQTDSHKAPDYPAHHSELSARAQIIHQQLENSISTREQS